MVATGALDMAFLGDAVFADVAAAYGDRPLFLTDDGEAIPISAVTALAAEPALKDCRRRIVLCLGDNEPGAVLGYLALMRCGAVPLLVPGSLTGMQLRGLIERYRPAFIWMPEGRATEVADASVTLSDRGCCLLAMSLDSDYPVHDNLALLLGTSGSTGSPRFVRLSHNNILSNARAIGAYLAIDPGDRPVTTLPLAYSYGLSVLHSHILVGSTIALTSKTLFDRGFWQFMKAVGATSFAGVPYHYDMLKRLRFADMDLPQLRVMTQAGGRMDKDLIEEFAALCSRKGMRFFSMYGQTEATARMAYLAPDKVSAKPESIGGAIPGGAFWLEDEQGVRVADPEGSGQLVYQGPNVAMGYANGFEDLGRGDEWGGVLHTGDLARRDADGDYYIVGRLKRFLKLFGNRINLEHVEEQAKSRGHDVLCAGRDDQLDVYLTEPAVETGRQLKKWLVETLKVTPKSIRVLAIDQFPRSDAGKVQYGLLDALEKRLLA